MVRPVNPGGICCPRQENTGNIHLACLKKWTREEKFFGHQMGTLAGKFIWKIVRVYPFKTSGGMFETHTTKILESQAIQRKRILICSDELSQHRAMQVTWFWIVFQGRVLHWQ